MADKEETSPKSAAYRSGCVALVGRPNAGKSTILNQLLGQKIAATTHKPQTTRKNLLGVLHPEGGEILLLDTPGYHKAKGHLNRFMVRQAKAALESAHVIGFVVEARADGNITPGNDILIDMLTRSEKPVVLVINKVDLIKKKDALLVQTKSYSDALASQLVAAVPISATRRKGLDRLVGEFRDALPQGDAQFEDGEITDQNERDIVQEFIREKVILETEQELPYSVAVSVEAFEDLRPKLVRVIANIYVERDSQKSIVIGKKGERLKSIGTRARKDIEYLVGTKVYLELHVRVMDRWSGDKRSLSVLGYE